MSRLPCISRIPDIGKYKDLEAPTVKAELSCEELLIPVIVLSPIFKSPVIALDPSNFNKSDVTTAGIALILSSTYICELHLYFQLDQPNV